MLEREEYNDNFIFLKSNLKKKLGQPYPYPCPKILKVSSCIPVSVSVSVSVSISISISISISRHHSLSALYTNMDMGILWIVEYGCLTCKYYPYWHATIQTIPFMSYCHIKFIKNTVPFFFILKFLLHEYFPWYKPNYPFAWSSLFSLMNRQMVWIKMLLLTKPKHVDFLVFVFEVSIVMSLDWTSLLLICIALSITGCFESRSRDQY